MAAIEQFRFAVLSFLTNAVHTETMGIDLVMNYQHRFEDRSRMTATLAGKYNKTTFDTIAGTPAPIAAPGITTPVFDLTQQLRFSDSLPRDKIALDLNYVTGPFTLSVTHTRYGRVATVALLNHTPAQVVALVPDYDVQLVPSTVSAVNSYIVQGFGAKIVTDINVCWQASRALRVSVGAQNAVKIQPDGNIASTVSSVGVGTNGADNAGTRPYNAVSPIRFNGRTVFLRGIYSF